MRSAKEPKAPRIVAAGPDSLRTWVLKHVEWAREKNYSHRTVDGRLRILTYFVGWAEARDVSRPVEVTKAILEAYQRHLFHVRKTDGRPLSFGTQANRMTALKSFFKWLAKRNVILSNPAADLELPKRVRRLPRAVLTIEEVERVLAEPDIKMPMGLRDRAILETLYSTGIRRSELVHLAVFDLDAERGTLMVRAGKGGRDRMVPIGDRALAWIERYLAERSSMVVPPDPGNLFLTLEGKAISEAGLSEKVRAYVDAADIGKKGSCHLLRHTCATLMVEGGADIRFVQELLGHVRLDTTQIYTHVSIRKLKQVHSATHPGAKLERPAGDG